MDRHLAQDVTPLIAIVRGDVEESIHHGAIAVADADGRILASAGSPDATTFLRSSAKPMQGLPLIASGAADRFGLTSEEIAITLGSHNGEPRQVEVVTSILRKIGSSEKDLLCGAHEPYHRPTARALRLAGREPTALHNNCSGKHAGMLALAIHRGHPPRGYAERDHPVQIEILDVMARVCGVPQAQIGLAVDGCTVPTFAMPLSAAARAYARLMEPERLDPDLGPAAQRAVDAMLRHPYMIAGEGRLDTDVMTAAEGSLIAKAGAEGYSTIAFRRGGKGRGVALKAADGIGDRARTAMILRALEDLALVPKDALDRLAAQHLGAILDRRGRPAARVEARFHLEPID